MFHQIIFIANAVSVGILIALFFRLSALYRSTIHLEQYQIKNPQNLLPSISIIVPIHNEEKRLEQAMKSLLALDYPNLVIIAVNDRSTDKTTSILNKMVSTHIQLKILNITALPENWLGKTHAMASGAKHSKSDYLLFTDADVNFRKDTLKKAIQLMLDQKLDHLSLAPDIKKPTWLLGLYLCFIQFCMFTGLKLWQKKPIIGIGAFNLIKRNVFNKIDAQKMLALSPIEDVTLAKTVVNHGFSSSFAMAHHQLSLTWYDSIKSAAIGFEKNIFAFFEFSVILSAIGLAMLSALLLLPWLGVFSNYFPATIAGGLNYLTTAFLVFYCTRHPKKQLLYSILNPLGGIIALYILSRSVLLSLCRGGMYWGNQFYSNRLLKKFMKKNKK